MEPLRGTLIYLCSLTVLAFAAAQHETISQNCTSQSQHFERLSAELQAAIECGKELQSHWTAEQTAALLLSMRTLTDTLHQHQLKECQTAEPLNCPAAEVPANGGLACVSVDNKRYCKPLCNHGYDFDFLRRSRIYEECSEETRYKWTTQYIGGNRLAVCSKSSIEVSGAKTAYFPKEQDCLKTKANAELRDVILEALKSELKVKEVQGEATHLCLICG